MSRPFETVERAGERKPSYFERGLFHAKDIGGLAKEFLNPEIDRAKWDAIEETVNRIPPPSSGKAEEWVQEVAEALTAEGLLSENFLYSGERAFQTVYACKPLDRNRDNRQFPGLDYSSLMPGNVNKSRRLETADMSYLREPVSSLPGTVFALEGVALLEREMIIAEHKMREASSFLAELKKMGGGVPSPLPAMDGQEVDSSRRSFLENRFVQWELFEVPRGKEWSITESITKWSSGLDVYLAPANSGVLNMWGTMTFDVGIRTYKKIEDESIYMVLDYTFSDISAPQSLFINYIACLGGLCFYERQLQESKENSVMTKRFSLYVKFLTAIKDIFEMGFVPLELGENPKIFMLTGAPPWKKALAEKMATQRSFQLGSPSSGPLTAAQALERMEELGLRAPTMAELTGLFGGSNKENK